MDKVAIISTVKAPIEELKMFIFHHKGIGVGEIIFFIDDYDGSDLSEIEQLDNVTLVKCDSDYWEELGVDRPISIESRQVMNVNRGATLAQSFGCKWLVHIDNDELLIVKNDIKTVFSCIDDSVDAVRFDMFEAVPDKINHCNIYEPRLFKVRSTRIQIFLAKLFGCRRAILDNEYFRAHSISKMAIRITDEIEAYGIHLATKKEKELGVVDTKDIRLLHFDCVGINAWKEKWSRRLDGSGRAVLMRPNRCKQLFLFKKAMKESVEEGSALEKLYSKTQCIPPYEKFILFLLGMLVTINFEESIVHKE